MSGSEHAEAVLRRVLAVHPWLDDSEVQHAGRGRYVRVFKYRSNVSLQVLHATGQAGGDSLEVGLAFDDNDRSENEAQFAEYRERLGKAELELGLRPRDGESGVVRYLTCLVPLYPAPVAAYERATQVCLRILDRPLGPENVRRYFVSRRDAHAGPRG